MHNIAANLNGKVPADGARLGRKRVGGSNNFAGTGNNAFALPNLSKQNPMGNGNDPDVPMGLCLMDSFG